MHVENMFQIRSVEKFDPTLMLSWRFEGNWIEEFRCCEEDEIQIGAASYYLPGK